jgi:hypothetical protein
MKENEEFPRNWYLIIDDDNRKIIDGWRDKCKYAIIGERNYFKYLTNECWIFERKESFSTDKVEITTEQFRVHILKLEPEIQISKSEDCKHLIKLFKKLKIK